MSIRLPAASNTNPRESACGAVPLLLPLLVSAKKPGAVAGSIRKSLPEYVVAPLEFGNWFPAQDPPAAVSLAAGCRSPATYTILGFLGLAASENEIAGG